MFNHQGRIVTFLLLVILIFVAIYCFMLKPPPSPPEDTPLLELMGTNWEQGVPVAIINGAVLQEGEIIEGFKVIKMLRSPESLSAGGGCPLDSWPGQEIRGKTKKGRGRRSAPGALGEVVFLPRSE